MSFETVIVQFEGFSPSRFSQTYFRRLAEQIRDESPSWATVRTSVHKAGKGFRGAMKITSAAGEFFVTANAERVTDLGHKLKTRVRRQLSRWKSKRISRETIRRAIG